MQEKILKIPNKDMIPMNLSFFSNIVNIKPTYEVTIGACYFCMIKSRTNTEIVFKEKVIELYVVKTLGLTPNVAELNIFASGILFDTINRTANADIALGVVALPEELLAEIQGAQSENGFTFNTTNDISREFAFGYWGENSDGSFTMVWHPVCKLVPTEETHETSSEDISEPNRGYSVRVIPWNGLWRTKYSTAAAIKADQTPLERAHFFAQPVYNEMQANALQAAPPPVGGLAGTLDVNAMQGVADTAEKPKK